MTEDKVKQVIESFDNIAKLSGQTPISEVIEQFSSKLPNEYRETILAQVKEDTAKAISEGMAKTTEALNKATRDPELLKKLKAVGPKEDD